MLPVLVAVVFLFAVLLLARIGGARRVLLAARWPALLAAAGAVYALSRGALIGALWLALLAVLVWLVWPALMARAPAPELRTDTGDTGDAQARALLGVGAGASEADIRRAYREKMARAHPDRGGAHNEAARLTAARDRLLKKKR